MSKPVNASGFLFMSELLVAALKSLESNATVTTFTGAMRDAGLELEFEVHITKVDGKPLPRMARRAANKAQAALRGER